MICLRPLFYFICAFLCLNIFTSCSSEKKKDLTVLISPYQDLAMLVNIKNLNLEKKYNTSVEIKTIPWEETYTTILSANSPADIAFASYADYLIKEKNLNQGSNDKLIFLYPAYIFKGGAFITFNNNIESLAQDDLNDPDAINKFLSHRIGFPKNSLYQMLIFKLMKVVDKSENDVDFVDVGFDAGFLASKSGALDISAVGLTQLTESLKEGGKSVLNMDTIGIADITGFIVKESVFKAKEDSIKNLVRMWFDSVDYVLSDIDNNSKASLDYLAKNAATSYTIESYKAALSQEYFPRSLKEVDQEIIKPTGKYPADKIHHIIYSFMVGQNFSINIKSSPTFIEMN